MWRVLCTCSTSAASPRACFCPLAGLRPTQHHRTDFPKVLEESVTPGPGSGVIAPIHIGMTRLSSGPGEQRPLADGTSVCTPAATLARPRHVDTRPREASRGPAEA